MSSSTVGLAPGNKIGPYTLVQQLGEGQGRMAQVYAATPGEGSWPTPVALKIANVLNSQGEFYTAALQNEVTWLRQLHHPHLIKLLPISQAEPITFLAQTHLAGRPWYMAVEYLPPASLATWLRQSPQGLPLTTAVGIGYHLAGVLDYLHAHRCIHMDLKPTNLLFRHPPTAAGAGEVVLIDLGSACENQQIVLNLPATFVASPYLPLEWLKAAHLGRAGELRAAPALDIYALGVMLYQMLTGRLPFVATHPGQLEAAILQGPPPKPGQFLTSQFANARQPDHNLVARLDQLLLSALDPEPARRPNTSLFAEQLAVLHTGFGGLAPDATPAPLPVAPPPPRQPGRGRALLGGALLFLLGAGVGVGLQPALGGLGSPTATSTFTLAPSPTATPMTTATPDPTPLPTATLTPPPTTTDVPTPTFTVAPTATPLPVSTLAPTLIPTP